MAKPVDRSAHRYEGVQTETPAARRRRQQRERSNEVTELAHYLLENDPEIETMMDARREARKQLDAAAEYEAGVKKGTIDPDTGQPTRRERLRSRSRSSDTNKPKSRARGRSSRPTRATTRIIRGTARNVAAPFGSAASAGWTLFQGGLSLVLLYALLRNAGAIGALVDGLTAGIRRFADPNVPLIPSAGEVTRTNRTRTVRNGQSARVGHLTPAAQRVVREAPVDPWAQAQRRAS